MQGCHCANWPLDQPTRSPTQRIRGGGCAATPQPPPIQLEADMRRHEQRGQGQYYRCRPSWYSFPRDQTGWYAPLTLNAPLLLQCVAAVGGLLEGLRWCSSRASPFIGDCTHHTRASTRDKHTRAEGGFRDSRTILQYSKTPPETPVGPPRKSGPASVFACTHWR